MAVELRNLRWAINQTLTGVIKFLLAIIHVIKGGRKIYLQAGWIEARTPEQPSILLSRRGHMETSFMRILAIGAFLAATMVSQEASAQAALGANYNERWTQIDERELAQVNADRVVSLVERAGTAVTPDTLCKFAQAASFGTKMEAIGATICER